MIESCREREREWGKRERPRLTPEGRWRRGEERDDEGRTLLRVTVSVAFIRDFSWIAGGTVPGWQ